MYISKNANNCDILLTKKLFYYYYVKNITIFFFIHYCNHTLLNLNNQIYDNLTFIYYFIYYLFLL